MATIPVDSRIDSKTAEFFSRQHRMLIDGRFVLAASGKTFPVYNPATGEVVAQVPEAEAGRCKPRRFRRAPGLR